MAAHFFFHCLRLSRCLHCVSANSIAGLNASLASCSETCPTTRQRLCVWELDYLMRFLNPFCNNCCVGFGRHVVIQFGNGHRVCKCQHRNVWAKNSFKAAAATLLANLQFFQSTKVGCKICQSPPSRCHSSKRVSNRTANRVSRVESRC